MASFVSDPNIPSSTGTPSIPAGSSITPDLVKHGHSIGVDVTSLRNKYINQKLSAAITKPNDEDAIKINQQLDDAKRLREMEVAHDLKMGEGTATDRRTDLTDAQLEQVKALEVNVETAKKLDRLVMCSRCHGQGMYKHYYNHQVRDVNCEQCDAEGLMWKNDQGLLVKQKDRPVAEKTRGLMSEADAMELAKNCGKRKEENADPLGLRGENGAGLADLDLDLPPAIF